MSDPMILAQMSYDERVAAYGEARRYLNENPGATEEDLLELSIDRQQAQALLEAQDVELSPY